MSGDAAPKGAMETCPARGCWQVLPEMTGDLRVELAGVLGGIWLTEVWRLHGARAAAARGAPVREITRQCSAALRLTGERVEVQRLLRAHGVRETGR